MAEVNTYKIGNKNLTEMLQDSVNRYYVTFSDYKLNGNNIAFASYNSNYHVFNREVGINNYFLNSNTTSNKGAVPRGYCPILQHNLGIISGYSKTYSVYYRGSGKPQEYGKLYIYNDSDGSYASGTETNPHTVPNVLILGLQGAGGVGQKGGDRWNWYGGQGGGSGAFLPVLVHLPYEKTDKFYRVFKVTTGGGGNGNANGGATTLYTADGTIMTHVGGGNKGSNSNGTSYASVSVYNSFSGNGIFNSGGVQFSIVPNYRTTYFMHYNSGSYLSVIGYPGCEGGNWINKDYYQTPYLGLSKNAASTSNSSYGKFYTNYCGSSSDKTKNGRAGAGSVYSSGGGYNSGGGSYGSGGGGGEADIWGGGSKGGSGGNGVFVLYY